MPDAVRSCQEAGIFVRMVTGKPHYSSVHTTTPFILCMYVCMYMAISLCMYVCMYSYDSMLQGTISRRQRPLQKSVASSLLGMYVCMYVCICMGEIRKQ